MTLQELEAGYFDQPAVGQREDLKRINELRAEQGLPLVDAKLQVPGAPKKGVSKKPLRDLSKARELYAAFKVKKEELVKHQEYAQKVITATEGGGMTPVEPLATMGCNGGPLLCDHCKKPILLEGGAFNRMPADEAWAKQSPVNRINWKAYISGGLVVELQTNYTVRIYHGYPNVAAHCCEIALREDTAKRDAHKLVIDKQMVDDLLEVIQELDKYKILNEVLNLMFSYDPGFGVNQP